jgi:signal recognition particle receptor subunit beta
MITLNTANERTLFFDFLPLQLGTIRGYRTRLHLYTVPGQKFYEASRKLILRGVDGIVFVADSQVAQMDANIESMQDLRNNLLEQRIDFKKVPMVMQWNKRDLPNISPVLDLNRELNHNNNISFEAVAFQGIGIFETLKTLSKLVLTNLQSVSSLEAAR